MPDQRSEQRGSAESIRGLIREAHAGSAEALGKLLDGCRAYLLLSARRELDPVLQAKGGASDLVQETFLEAQQAFGRFHGQTRRELVLWLRTILRNNLADFRRRWREAAARQVGKERSLDVGDRDDLCRKLVQDVPSPGRRLAQAEEFDALDRALGQLSEEYRRVIVLRSREGRSFAEVGQRMDRTAAAARMLWLRAVGRLTEILKGGRGDAGAPDP